MSLLVLSYPEISDVDFNWIQNYRKEHDPLFYHVVSPHFTIVFPTFNISEEDFITEIEYQSKNLKSIQFEIKCVVINKDSFLDVYHGLLVPDKGFSDIVKLHDKLYSGKLFPNLRLDVDFIPHIGISNSQDPIECKKRVDELNKSELSINGKIKTLDVVKYENESVTTLKVFKLI
jgi:hypothetical protein